MKRIALILFTMACLFSAASPAAAQLPDFKLGKAAAKEQSFGDSRDRVKVSAVADQKQVKPGSDFVIAVVFEHEEGWHTWTNEGNVPTGMTTFSDAIHTEIKIGPDSNKNLSAHAGFIVWPQVHQARADIGDGPQDYAVFADRAVAYLPVTVSPATTPGTVQLKLLLTYQTCDAKTCLAPVADQELIVDIEVVDANAVVTAGTSANAGLFTAFDPSVWTA